MARLTVQDCLEHIGDRYALVMLATQRARQIISGARLPMLEENGDKPMVVALREIAEGKINAENIDIKKEDDISEKLGMFADMDSDAAKNADSFADDSPPTGDIAETDI